MFVQCRMLVKRGNTAFEVFPTSPAKGISEGREFYLSRLLCAEVIISVGELRAASCVDYWSRKDITDER